ncbi:MAG: metallophosphatase [Prevotella sp.]|nr:metallophosphatase [Prevotella sp.]MBQ9224315.1 metallophosphatase [Prevotella sp.]
MKRYIIISLLLLGILNVQAQNKQLVVLHTNDTHSTILPLNPNLADTMKAGRGGFIRRIAMLKEERRKNPDLLLFDSGDFCQGSPYFTLYKGDVEVGLMNMMGYDAGTIGNHEFDFGLDAMAKMFRNLNYPIVCSNYDFRGTVVEGLVKDYVILKRKGMKIGVFGLSPALSGLVSNDNCVGVKYLDPVKEANRVVDILKKKKCDVIICISHLGWQDSYKDGDEYLVSGTRGIDLVLGGHSHTYFETLRYVKNLDGKEIPVDQNGKHALFVGKMVLEMSKK